MTPEAPSGFEWILRKKPPVRSREEELAILLAQDRRQQAEYRKWLTEDE